LPLISVVALGAQHGALAAERQMARGIDGRDSNRTLSSRIDIPLTAALLAVPVVAALASTPAHLQITAIAAFALLAAAAVATLAFVARADRIAGSVTLWDLAGACALIGIAAGMFSQPLHVTQFFGVAIAP
jgi:hypothetical protein